MFGSVRSDSIQDMQKISCDAAAEKILHVIYPATLNSHIIFEIGLFQIFSRSFFSSETEIDLVCEMDSGLLVLSFLLSRQ